MSTIQLARSLQSTKRPATVNDENLEAQAKKASVHLGKENAVSIKTVISVQAQKRDPLKDKKTNIPDTKAPAVAEVKPAKTEKAKSEVTKTTIVKQTAPQLQKAAAPSIADLLKNNQHEHENVDAEPMSIDEAQHAHSLAPLSSLLQVRLPEAAAAPAPAPAVAPARKSTIEIDDIDAEAAEDPTMLPVYAQDVFAYFREKEVTDRPDPNYLNGHPELTPAMRAMMVDWLVEVHLEFRLLSETLYLAINILDRFLSACAAKKKTIQKSRLQLIGIASMLIASKVEEINEVSIDDFIYISSNAYVREDIVRQESQVLNMLGWNLTVPTALHFLRRFSKAARADTIVHTLAKYLIELSLVDYVHLQFVPSMISAAAVYLARRIVARFDVYWTPTLQHFSCLSEQQLMPCARALNDMLKNRKKGANSNLQAVTRKYFSSTFYSVAKLNALENFE